MAYYEGAGDEVGAITVHAALPVGERPGGRQGFGVVDLGEIPAAATLIHHGSMDNVLSSIQALAKWIDASGYQSLGYAREVTLKSGDVRDDWVTELQEPIAPKEDDGDIRGGTLPAGRFAVMTHTGAPETLVAATSALLDWAEARGLAWDVSQTDTGERWAAAWSPT